MPFIHVKIAGPVLPPVDVICLQQEITAMMAGILRKKAELTSVLVEQVSCSGWSIGGASRPDSCSSCCLDHSADEYRRRKSTVCCQGTRSAENGSRIRSACCDLRCHQ